MATNNGNQLAVQPQRNQIAAGTHGLRLSSIEDMFRFATAVSKSGIAPRGLSKPEQILVALEYGAELGLRPMQALATVMVVNGRATLWGDGMLAVSQASGLLEDIRETIAGTGDKMVATCEVKRKGRPTPSVASFSWADAKQAGLTGKDTYKQYPGRMLKARARAFALRDALPDVLCGVISSEEAADYPDVNAAPVFADGSQQAPTDLEQLVETDEIVQDDAPFEGSDGTQEADDGDCDDSLFAEPSEEDLRRDGLIK